MQVLPWTVLSWYAKKASSGLEMRLEIAIVVVRCCMGSVVSVVSAALAHCPGKDARFVGDRNMGLLESIHIPTDIRRLSMEELTTLAAEIRDRIVQSVSKTAAIWPVISAWPSLRIALHYVYDFGPYPTGPDWLLWDVGHQCYAHKMLTGRARDVPHSPQKGLRQRIPQSRESPYDLFAVGHAGTAISTAVGMARGDRPHAQNRQRRRRRRRCLHRQWPGLRRSQQRRHAQTPTADHPQRQRHEHQPAARRVQPIPRAHPRQHHLRRSQDASPKNSSVASLPPSVTPSSRSGVMSPTASKAPSGPARFSKPSASNTSAPSTATICPA